jgi:hypothetical protein
VALSPAFTVAQTVGNPSVLVITDTSTGSDGTITQRRVYLQKADGTYLVPDGTTTDYIEWALADTEIEIDALDKDYGLSILVEWLNVSDVVVEDLEDEYALSLYNETFDYGLTQLLAVNPLLINDNNFWNNKSDLRTLIDSGNQAIAYGGDIFACQQCFDKATELRLDSEYYFNGNS